MEHEQEMPAQEGGKGWGKCDKCGCGGKWQHKHWKHHGGRGGMCGGLWFGAWLFTIGFLKLTFWKGVFALVVWPYFIGAFLAR